MSKLKRDDLYTLEKYAQIRKDFKARVMAEKQHRRVPVGPHVMLHFENRLIMQYQVQEMLRVEKIFEPEGIQEELDTYNPLIPDGSNWKATMMIEYEDPEVRDRELTRLIGIERNTWVRVEGFDKVYAIADEDLERENETKTSSVHFLRFELTPEMVSAVKQGAQVSVGIDHPNYRHENNALSAQTLKSLTEDLQ